ncbi:MAG: alpha-galactosidase, partial [Bacteroidetes bacterium]|nr:alpha-galactosidase [Bacteroidota bacterium]
MRITLLLLMSFLTQAIFGQNLINIESADYAIVMQTDDVKRLRHVYFGPKLNNKEDYRSIAGQLRYNGTNEDVFNHAYTPSGTWNVAEPALQIIHADGNPSTELDFVSHETTSTEPNVALTTINLKDPRYQTEVKLYYQVYQAENVFVQWTEIKNGEKGKIKLEKYASANMYFRNEEFFLAQYHGSWAQEMQPQTHQLTAGIKVL